MQEKSFLPVFRSPVPIFWPFIVFITLFLVLSPLPVRALEISISKVVDTMTWIPGRERFELFRGIGRFEYAFDSGNTVFTGTDLRGQRGLWAEIDGVLQTVYDRDISRPDSPWGYPFQNYGTTDISGSEMAFVGWQGRYEHSIYANTGGAMREVIDGGSRLPDGFFISTLNNPVIDGNNVLARMGDSRYGAILLQNDTETRVLVQAGDQVADGSGQISSLGFRPDIDQGEMAYLATTAFGGGIFVDRNGRTDKIAGRWGAVPDSGEIFANFRDPSISDGKVAFFGWTATGAKKIVSDVSGRLEVIADTSMSIPGGVGNFVGFGSGFNEGEVAIDGKRLAFAGTGLNGQEGIYSYMDGMLDEIVSIGDMIDGREILDLGFRHNALSGDSLLFWAEVENPGYRSIYGLYRADILNTVPEPSILGLMLVGVMLLKVSQQRQSRVRRR